MDRLTTLAFLALLVSGCRIGDVTFTPLGGPDDGNLDDTPIMLIDAPSGLQPLLHGFIIDQNAGIWSMNKNAQSGDLTLASPTPYNGGTQPTVAATNRTGTHLYVAGGQTVTEIRDYAVNNSILTNNPTVIPLGNCGNPRSITIHPNGRFLFVGCSGPTYVRVSIDATGSIATKQEFTALQGPMTVAFSPNGACLTVVDANGPITQRVQTHQFDALSGALTGTPATSGPTGAAAISMHPSNRFFYVGGNSLVTAYALEPTTCESVALNGGSVTGPPSTGGVAVDPQGGRLFVVGPEVRAYSIAANGLLSPSASNPFLTGSSLIHAVFDPVVPSTIYVTGRTPNGTYQGEIDMSTGSFPIGQGYMTPNGAPSMFVMAP